MKVKKVDADHFSQEKYEQFVRTWQGASSLTEVMGKFKLSRAAASMRACLLRKKGVKLKKFARGFPAIDYSALIDIAGGK